MSRPVLILIFMTTFLSACASAPAPKEVYYRFTNSNLPQPTAATALPGKVRVERLKAEGILSERPLLFSHAESPGRLQQYRYHLWAEAPASLLTQWLIKQLQAAAVAEQVVDADLRTPVDYSIDGSLLRLERVIASSGKDSAVVELQLRLVKFSTRELVQQHRYLQVVPLEGDGLTDVTRAMSKAADTIFRQFIADLTSASDTD